jgi:hypothetical protein
MIETAREAVAKTLAPDLDGDHSGHAVVSDLDLSKEYLTSRGMIVIDDYFNAQYPKITAVTYKWLDLNPEYRMVLCGFNNAYIVPSHAYDLYESVIQKHLSAYLTAVDEDASLTKTSYTHDMGCWGLIQTANQPIIGRDQAPEHFPY